MVALVENRAAVNPHGSIDPPQRRRQAIALQEKLDTPALVAHVATRGYTICGLLVASRYCRHHKVITAVSIPTQSAPRNPTVQW